MSAFDFNAFTDATADADDQVVPKIERFDSRGLLFTAVYNGSTTITVKFNSVLAALAATSVAANYTITGTSAPTVTVASFGAPSDTVTLTLSGALTDSVYTLTLADSTACDGNVYNLSGLVVTIIGTVTSLAGDIVGTSAASSSLTTQIQLAGNIVGTSSATANLSAEIHLAGDIVGTSAATGALTAVVQLAGNIVGTSATSGDLTTEVHLAGNIVGTSAAAATLTTEVHLAGSATGTSAATGDLTTEVHLAGSAVGTSSATGDLHATIHLFGDIVGTSAASGNLTSSSSTGAALVGDIVGSSALTGNLTTVFGMAVTENQKTTILDPVDDFLESAFANGVTVGASPYLPATILYHIVTAKNRAANRDWCRSALASFLTIMRFDRPGTTTVIPINKLTPGGSAGSLTIVGGLIVDRVDPT